MKLKVLFVKSNTTKYFDENCILTENYNEQLDTFSGHISHLSSELNIEPFDKVQIIDEDGILSTRYMDIESYVMQQDSMGSENSTYSYDISFISETKELEGIILPNLSITPLTTGTKRTIWYYLNEYLSRYGTKVKSGNTLVAKYTFASRVQTKFNSVDAPELQFTTPTLREIFTELMSVKDCMPVVKNNIIDYIDLTQTTGTFSNYNYLQKSRNADDYLSEIKIDMQNILGQETATINGNWEPLTTTEYIINSENVFLKTDYPILKINHLWIATQYNGWIVEDLCNIKGINDVGVAVNMVYEYDEFKTKQIAYKTDDVVNPDKFAYLRNYQNFCLYYNRGSNGVYGFTQKTKEGLFANKSWVELMWEKLIKYGSYQNIIPRTYEQWNGENQLSAFIFKIEYETTKDAVFTATKDEKTANTRTIVDNQTNSWVDGEKQYRLEQQKANRMGNEIIMYNQRLAPNETPISIGQTNGDNIVYKTQYQIHSDHTEVNAFATKNYILKNYFTGVNQKVRTWRNATDEAFVRHELDKNYCEFHFSTNSTQDQMMAHQILNAFDPTNTEPIRKSAIYTTKLGKYYYIDVVARRYGNSLLFTAGLDNNTYIRQSIDKDKINVGHIGNIYYIQHNSTYGGIPLTQNVYVDSNYEVDDMTIVFTNDFDKDDIYNGKTEQQVYPDPSYRVRLENAYRYPEVVDQSALLNNVYFTRHFINKDNKEIPQLTAQFEMISNDIIYMTENFIDNAPVIRNYRGDDYRIYLAPSSSFVKNAKTLPAGAIMVGYTTPCNITRQDDFGYLPDTDDSEPYELKFSYPAYKDYDLENVSFDYNMTESPTARITIEGYHWYKDTGELGIYGHYQGYDLAGIQFNYTLTATAVASGKSNISVLFVNQIEFSLNTYYNLNDYAFYVADLQGNVWLGADLSEYPVETSNKVKLYLDITKIRE